MIQRRVFVSGVVQGVGYRASTQREARAHPQVKGWVKNLADGRVEAVFAGPEADVEALIAWCRKGPTAAQVTDVVVYEEKPDGGLRPFHVE